nr:G2/M phase-specific E3 ubiquitin-protein ligase-like [Pseudochaenichthys georgianus]
MSLQKNIMKPVRGKTLPLILDPDTDAAGLHGLAVKKMTDFNSDMDQGPYVLIYPDTSEVINIPGTSTPFNLREYKKEIGKTYNRIALFICLESDYDKGEQQDASDSDLEVFVRRNRRTEPWEPEHESTPKSIAEKTSSSRASYQSEKEEILISDTDDPKEGTSQSWRNTATSVPDTPSNMTAVRSTVNPLYSTYTQLYAPIAIDEDEDGSQDFNVVPISADPAKEAVFKDGLASLHFLDALCQHPSVLAPVLCHTDKRLTSVEVERLFLPQLSPAGSNRRTTETVALSFWADYLMDCEEQGPVSLEELYMFITGLKTEPPAGMTPHPCVTFSQETIYPLANTCANTITLPLLGTYANFKANMDFGIQNSPGFGCL